MPTPKLTWFMFVNAFDEHAIVSLGLDDQGLQAPVITRAIDEILASNPEKIIIVLSTSYASLHQIQLPLFAEKKTRMALLYALEDQLVEPLANLHIAFDKHYYSNHQYLVAVISRAYLSDCIAWLTTLGIKFDAITLDFFALNSQEAKIFCDGVLINNNNFKGLLGPTWAKQYQDNAFYAQLDVLSYLDIATRLDAKPLFNLAQGSFKIKHKVSSYKKILCLIAIGLLSLLIQKSFIISQLNHALDTISAPMHVSINKNKFFWQTHNSLAQAMLPEIIINQLSLQNNKLIIN